MVTGLVVYASRKNRPAKVLFDINSTYYFPTSLAVVC
jgi:hypothetical protein